MFEKSSNYNFASSLAVSLFEDNGDVRSELVNAILQSADLSGNLFVIGNEEDAEFLLWSNKHGWTNSEFELFTASEKEQVSLPSGGRWMVLKDAMQEMDADMDARFSL